MKQWTVRLSIICLVLSGVVGWRIVSVHQLVVQLQHEHQQRIEVLAKARAEVARLAEMPPASPVDALDAAMHRVRTVITSFREAGLSADLSTAPSMTVTVDAVSLQAIPCRLSLQADSLPRLITAVQLLERTQVLLTSLQLTAQTADVSFQVIGGETRSAPTVIAAKEK